MKIACIGDFHIPSRAKKIPDWIVNILKKEKLDIILCHGDLEAQEVLDFLETFCEVKCVQGNVDWLDLPLHQTLKTKHHTISLIHGSGIVPRGDQSQLMEHAKSLGCDVLVNGHTHVMKVYAKQGVLFVNPGTACGVWGGSSGATSETFIILEVNNKITVRMFEDKGEKVWVGKPWQRKILKKNGKR